MKRFAWITAILVAGGILITLYVLYTNPNPDYANRSPHVTMEATALLSSFEKTPEQATANYMDKIVRVKGIIKMIDTSGSLVMTGDDPVSEIIVAMDPRYKSSLSGIKQGDTISIQGLCSGYSADAADATDMLASLGATIRFHSAGIKQ